LGETFAMMAAIKSGDASLGSWIPDLQRNVKNQYMDWVQGSFVI
jgi:hypothetical protein